jgi:alkylation response protein AidB-like acyl-CoA dehydrogenase
VDLQLSGEQTLLRESVDELLARAAAADETWRELIAFGALDVDDGIGAVELALVAHSVGRALAAVPFAESAAFAYVAGGRERTALCIEEPGRSFAPAAAETWSVDGRVTGEKDAVSFAERAERLAVAAAGPVVLVVDAGADGVAIEPEPALDPTLEMARVRFAGAEAAEVPADVRRLSAAAGVLVSAEAVGAASALLELARAYAGQRRQFGQTIGSFQAIRHLLADMYVDVESSWSSVLYAAAALDEGEPDCLRTASVAKAHSARSALAVAHGALQVFGGIAFTAEHPAHRFLRRIATRGDQFGSVREHERSLGRWLAGRAQVPA